MSSGDNPLPPGDFSGRRFFAAGLSGRFSGHVQKKADRLRVWSRVGTPKLPGVLLRNFLFGTLKKLLARTFLQAAMTSLAVVLMLHRLIR